MGEAVNGSGGTLAVLEVLDRDGSVRHSVSVREWPLRVGRALDNDLVLDDAHTAAHHFSVAPDDQGVVQLIVGDSINGLQVEALRMLAGERLPVGDTPPLLTLGRTHLRLRLASHALAPEQALSATRVLRQGLPTLAWLAVAAALVMGFGTWLESDPDVFAKALGSSSIYAVGVALGWVGLWTLLSKVFTRQGHFGWHVRVLLIAMLAWQAMLAGTSLLAFAFSWPWVTDFSFMLAYLIFGSMLYFHLQAVEPHHPRRTRAFAMASVVMGVGLSLWFNQQSGDRLGAELYMNHLFPPAVRVAKPVDTLSFMQGAAALQTVLDAKAKKDVND
ncbi:MAG: FHA domain-containing protein [Cytophagales bacterium]|nr:FHA domain-containing protein [Rhizobacter sp.]